jgi:hypothetical protein
VRRSRSPRSACALAGLPTGHHSVSPPGVVNPFLRIPILANWHLIINIQFANDWQCPRQRDADLCSFPVIRFLLPCYRKSFPVRRLGKPPKTCFISNDLRAIAMPENPVFPCKFPQNSEKLGAEQARRGGAARPSPAGCRGVPRLHRRQRQAARSTRFQKGRSGDPRHIGERERHRVGQSGIDRELDHAPQRSQRTNRSSRPRGNG